MSQPFDDRDWDLLRIAEKDVEIGRLRAEHEEMLLKHAREQGVALDLLEAAMAEVERYKALVRRGAEALEKIQKEWPIEELGLEAALIGELREAAE